MTKDGSGSTAAATATFQINVKTALTFDAARHWISIVLLLLLIRSMLLLLLVVLVVKRVGVILLVVVV